MRLLILCLSFLIASSFVMNDFKKVNLKKLKGKYSYIPSGKVEVEETTFDVFGFYMMSTEVSNMDYREFLSELRKNEETDLLAICQIGTDRNLTNEMQQYLQHPAYNDYPVVGLSKKAAELYCSWLGKKLTANQTLGKDVKNVIVRLPSEYEWILAARGGKKDAIYPWGGYYTRNSKGQKLANFHQLDESKITFNEQTNKYEILGDSEIPYFNYVQIKANYPNDFGLYNMSGNVAEMIADKDIVKGGSFKSGGHDIKISSSRPFTGTSNEVGFRPVFTVEFTE